MSVTFVDDFTDNIMENTTFDELKTSLQEALKTSTNSIMTAHYPKQNYEDAVIRLHVKADLNAIRQNTNNEKAIKIYLDFILDDGTCSSDINPDFAKMEMSYANFSNLISLEFVYDVITPLVNKLKSWDDTVKKTDSLNTLDVTEENIVVNSEPEFDEIKGLLENGQMIEAIRVYREITGFGLADAKEAIDKYVADNNITVPANNQKNNSQTKKSSGAGCTTAIISVLMIIISICVIVGQFF